MTRLTRDTTLRRCKDVVFSRVEDESVLLSFAQERYYGLNEVGTRAWELLGEHGRISDLAQHVAREFQVDLETAETDVLRLAGELLAAGLVEET